MSFTEIFIRRPVLSSVISLLILLLGLQGIMNLQVREYPEVKETTVTITTVYVGASADLIQGFITTPIAKAVISAEGVDYVTSSSRLGVSTVSVQMKLNADPNAALTEVNAKVQAVRAQLPQEAEDPVVAKGTGQTFALMYLTFASPRLTPEQVTEYLVRVVQPRLSTLEGVADAQILGGRDFAMRVWIDPLLLASRGVTASDVVSSIRSANFLSAPGKTDNDFVAYSLNSQTTLQTPEAFGLLPLKSDGDEIVRLRDVARVELGPENTDVKVMFSGREGTFIGVTTTPTANPLDVAKLVHAEVDNMQQSLPEGMTAEVVYDASSFIEASIEEVFKTIAEAVVIVVLVILLFLGSFRSVIIPVVTIPLSLIGVCVFLFALGFSLNLLTLLAMVLAIGLVVDDAIVVVENIHRHIEEGYTPTDAAIVGMREIFGPIVSMTITLAAVYAPIGFASGLTGALFREFAFTLAGAVIISGVVAVTLSPMMASKLLKPHTEGGPTGFAGFVDRTFERVERRYRRMLSATLNVRWATLIMVAALLGTTGFMFLNTSSELAPEEDQGVFLGIVNAPKYANSDYTNFYVREFHKLREQIPEVQDTFSIVGTDGAGGAFMGFKLKTWADRTGIPAAETKQKIQSALDKSPGVQAFIFSRPSLPGTGGGLPVQMVIRSLGSPEQVFEIGDEIRKKAQASGKFIVVQNSMSFETPQARIIIDRDRAASLGVPVSDIGSTLGALVGNAQVSKFDRENRSYDVITQVAQQDRLNPELLGKYYVRSASGSMIPLSALVSFEARAAPAAIEQFNQLNSATIAAVPLPTVTSADGLAAIEQIARETMPQGFFLDYIGQSRQEKIAGNTLLVAFGLAVLIIYLVLAAQFESFRDPFIILMSVPLSLFGAMLFLNMGLATLNIYTQVGLITLIGLITKHGILMVEFANEQRREKGLGRRDAIVRAAEVRLRPILMTTAAMVLGVAPLLLASGAGAAARFSMGLVICSGMAIGTIFTLFVVPMFYTLISRREINRIEAASPELAPSRAPSSH
jgi:multidrug efflux pump